MTDKEILEKKSKMSNALDDLVADIDRLVSEMGSNLPPDETSRRWYAGISAQWLAFNRRLRDAIKEEREEHVSIAIDNFEDGKRKGYAMAKAEIVPSPPPEFNHERFANSYDSALRTYKYETGEVVYNYETMYQFCQWLFSKCCDKDCPFYRIVEGECRPPCCTNPCGHCFNAREEEP